MSFFTKQRLRDAAIYYVKAFAFAIGSYLLMMVIYGGSRLSFFAWTSVIFLAFTIAYIPYVVRGARDKRGG